jgi:photosystem II stability/assembly factor-like uncharacterized protein
MKKTAAVVLLLLVAPLSARAGVNRWTPFGRGDDTVFDLLLTQEGLYVMTADGRLFRSDDGGSAWQYLAVVGRRMAADPADPRVMTSVTFHGAVYRSVDAGRSWGRLPGRVDAGTSNPGVASMKTAAGTIYVGGQHLYVSRDRGQTWTTANRVAGPVRGMAVDPSRPRTVWFATADGLWKTPDAGRTFSLVLGSAGFNAVAFSPSRPAKVYAVGEGRSYSSQDGGATWRPGGNVGFGGGSLAVDPANPAQVYAASWGIIAFSRDGGATWTIPTSRPRILSLLAAGSNTLLAGTDADGLQVSNDGGLSWSRRDRTGMGYPQVAFLERDPVRGALYLHHDTFGSALVRSLDDGQTWTPLTYLRGDQLRLLDLAVDRSDPGVVYTVGLDGAFRVEPDGTTTRLPVLADGDWGSVATTSRAVVIVSTSAGYRSEDGGLTWKDVLPHVAGTTPGGIAIERGVLDLVEDPLDPNTLYALTIEYGGVPVSHVTLRSGDGGLTWAPAWSGPVNILAADPHDPGTLYSVVEEGGHRILYESPDRGDHWSPVGTIPGGWVISLVADTKNPDVLWASNERGVQRSGDGGRTWVPFNPGLARPRLTREVKLTPDPAVPGRIYAMPLEGGLFELTTP